MADNRLLPAVALLAVAVLVILAVVVRRHTIVLPDRRTLLGPLRRVIPWRWGAPPTRSEVPPLEPPSRELRAPSPEAASRPEPEVHRFVIDGQEREPRLPAWVVTGSSRHGSFFHGWCGTTTGPYPTARLNVRGATLRGVGHAQNGVDGQDVIGAAWDERRGVLYIAVADGVGSLPRSGRVAQEAITAALHMCLTRPDDIAFDVNGPRLYEAIASGLVRSLGDGGDRIDGASTLVVAEIEPRFDGAHVTVHGIGDSEAWALYEGAWRAIHHERGDRDNATRELPGHVRPLTHRYELPPGAVLVLGSDGFTSALDESVSPVSRGLARLWRHRPDWLDFLNHISFVEEYFADDRSAVAVWIGSGPDNV